MARFPVVEFDDDLVADLRRTRQHDLARVNVDVVDEARIVRDDVMELLGLLERADDVAVRALQDADDPALPPRDAGAAIAPAVLVLEAFADDPCDTLSPWRAIQVFSAAMKRSVSAGLAADDEGVPFFVER